jgi:small basic protein (TIGR04137 family)
MSIHKSLKVASKLTRARNVLTRYERLLRLKELGKWDETKDSIFHLPKTKQLVLKKLGKKKKKKEEAEAAPGAEGAAAAPAAAGAAAAPAAGGKPAAGAAAAKGAAAAPAAKGGEKKGK